MRKKSNQLTIDDMRTSDKKKSSYVMEPRTEVSFGGSTGVPEQGPVFRSSVKSYWRTRQDQADAAKEKSGGKNGEGSDVRGGQHMNQFAATIERIVKSAIPGATIRKNRSAIVPGFFRPTKNWDMTITISGKLKAVVELKSLTGGRDGDAFGKNANNRVEEALGGGTDLAYAFSNETDRPWRGYLLLVEKAEVSTRNVASSTKVDVRREFAGEDGHQVSYCKRMELFCTKLIETKLYDSVCFILSDRSQASGDQNYEEPSAALGARQFIDGLLGALKPTK